MSWLNATVKDRYIEFRRALRDLPEVLEHGQPLRRDYYVYVHKDQDGNIFYVGKGTGKRAWSQERDDVWHRYVKEKLSGRYEVEIIRDELDEEEALELENEIMSLHGDRLLNHIRPSGGLNVTVSIDKDQIRLEGPTISNGMKIDWEPNDRYWVLRDANKAVCCSY
jgi:hypothetical protein